MQQRQNGDFFSNAQGSTQLAFEVVNYAAFDARNAGSTAMLRDIRGLGRPGRNRAQTWHNQDYFTGRFSFLCCQTQYTIQQAGLRIIEGFLLQRAEIAMARAIKDNIGR